MGIEDYKNIALEFCRSRGLTPQGMSLIQKYANLSPGYPLGNQDGKFIFCGLINCWQSYNANDFLYLYNLFDQADPMIIYNFQISSAGRVYDNAIDKGTVFTDAYMTNVGNMRFFFQGYKITL